MEITRLTLPLFAALSNAEIESWLRIDADQDKDTVAMLIGSATEYCEGVTGSAIGLSNYLVELDGIAGEYPLPIAPVQSVIKVQYRDDTGTLQDIDPAEWTFMGRSVRFSGLPAGSPIVTLEAGNDRPVAIPLALRHAIAVLVSAGFNGREEMSEQTMRTVDRLCQQHKRFAW